MHDLRGGNSARRGGKQGVAFPQRSLNGISHAVFANVTWREALRSEPPKMDNLVTLIVAMALGNQD